MRPVGREKTAYKAVKAAKKVLPVKGMIIALAALLCAGFIFSVVTTRPGYASASASEGSGMFQAEDSADDTDSLDVQTGQQETAKADEQKPNATANDQTQAEKDAAQSEQPSDKTDAAQTQTGQPSDKTDTGKGAAQSGATAEKAIRTIDLSPSEREATEKARREKKDTGDATYIGNARSKKFHYPGCVAVTLMNWENVVFFYGGREELTDLHYIPCKLCKP